MTTSIFAWSRTAADNDDADATVNWLEGQAASTVNNSARAMMARVAELLADIGATQTTGGSANAHTLTARSGFTAYATGIVLAFKAGFTNTGATTLNVNAIGAKAIRKFTTAEAALAANDIIANGIFVVIYDAAANGGAGAWILQNPLTLGGAASITSGSITGITDLAVADGGTGASSASDARTNLGLAIGTDVQAFDADLTTLGGLSKTDGNFIVADGSAWTVESGATARTSLGLGSIATQASSNVTITGGSVTGITDLAVADGGTGASSAANARSNLGLVIGTDVAPVDNPNFTGATLSMTTTDAGAGTAPVVILDRNSASPAASDIIASIAFTGRDSGGNSTTYANILTVIEDPTNGSEDGTLQIRPLIAGSASVQLEVGNGILIGSPTGGFKGSGNLNISGEIYQNNAKYTHPDYVFERYFTGKIERFRDNKGAAEYTGMMPLAVLRAYVMDNLCLPGAHERRGIFERGDFLLEKVEELHLRLFEMSERLARLEAKG